MKKVYTIALAVVVTGVMTSASGFISGDAFRVDSGELTITKSKDCSGDQDRSRDGSCQDAITTSSVKELAADQIKDQTKGQTRDPSKDASCQDAITASGVKELAADQVKDQIKEQSQDQKKDQTC